MHSYPIQLFDPDFQPSSQFSLLREEEMPFRYVVKLHRATRLYYDLRFELFGRLLSFAINDLENCWSTAITPIFRVNDHDLKYMLGERCIPRGQHGAGPSLVWDHGIYGLLNGTQNDVYHRFLNGYIELDLRGVRLCGRFRIYGHGMNWNLERISGDPAPVSTLSVLTGRTLDEIESGIVNRKTASRIWLEWDHFYTEQSLEPEVVVQEKKVSDHNFAANTLGITNGMLLQHVLPLVPNCRIRLYSPKPELQQSWLNRLLRYANIVQPYEHHSAAADLSGHPDSCDIARKIVVNQTTKPVGHLRYGVGPSVWTAQLAEKLKDPFLFADNTQEKLAPLGVEHLLDVLPEDRERLRNLGFETIGDVAETSKEKLRGQFGDLAHRIVNAALGKTSDQVASLYPPNAVSHYICFEAPINDELTLRNAAGELSKRLATKIIGKQVGLFVVTAQSEDGSVQTIRRPCNRPVNAVDRIQANISYLVAEVQKRCPDIVQLTVRLDRLEAHKSSQQHLFTAVSRTDSETTLASLKTALGSSSVILASEIKTPRRVQVLRAWRNATGWN